MLFARELSVVSMGMSCQTANQISQNKALISELAQTELIERSTYMDYVITDVNKLITWFDDDCPAYPELNEISILTKPGWLKYGMYFWHDFGANKHETYESVVENYQLFISKRTRKRDNLKLCSQSRRTYVFWSNTQNNLTDMPEMDFQNINPVVRVSQLVQLKQRYDQYIGQESIFNVVTYPERMDIDVDVKGITINYLERDQSGWQGDVIQWQNVFRKSINGLGFVDL